MTAIRTSNTQLPAAPRSIGSTGEVRVNVYLGNFGPIPPDELWLYENHQALAAVLRGRDEVARGDTHYMGSFAQYADLPIDD